jgi:prepilin-type N-terminal cleavage/methylation domain-containing protein
MMLHRTPRGQSGFSLIETLAALTLFTIVTLGVTPVMISSLRGASLSRSYTKGKNLAVQAMERIRGLPYFVSVGSITPATEPRVDVLDLYFPDMTPSGSSGYQSGTRSFITTCDADSDSPAASGALACPQQVPAGHTVKFEATFVTPSGSELSTVVPSVYNWNSTSTETAPSPLLKMVVEVSWTQNGATRSTSLTTLLAQRDLAEDETRGSAQIDYVVQGLTGYVDSSGIPSNLIALVGSSESRIETRTVTAADQTVETGRLTLTREEVGSDPAVTLADEFGASNSLHAPPNSYPAPDVVGSPIAVTHPDLALPVAGLGVSTVDDPGVKVENDLPTATGGFNFDTSVGLSYEVFNDPGSRGIEELHLADGAMLSAERVGASELSGATNAYATALTPTAARKVETTATAGIAKLRMLPAAFVRHPDASVIVITDFSASLTCRATANVGTSTATGGWSATLWYWADLDPSDGIAAGQYVSVPLSGATGSAAIDPLAELKASSNPLVFDHFDSAKDVYLFDDGNGAGYITDWSSRPLVQSSIDTSGRKSTVDLDGAIQITSTAVNPAVPRSKVTASVGAMSCEAVDKRGL